MVGIGFIPMGSTRRYCFISMAAPIAAILRPFGALGAHAAKQKILALAFGKGVAFVAVKLFYYFGGVACYNTIPFGE